MITLPRVVRLGQGGFCLDVAVCMRQRAVRRSDPSLQLYPTH
jgi:hypothetical protein